MTKKELKEFYSLACQWETEAINKIDDSPDDTIEACEASVLNGNAKELRKLLKEMADKSE